MRECLHCWGYVKVRNPVHEGCFNQLIVWLHGQGRFGGHISKSSRYHMAKYQSFSYVGTWYFQTDIRLIQRCNMFPRLSNPDALPRVLWNPLKCVRPIDRDREAGQWGDSSILPHSVLGNSYSWRARVSEREAETKGPDLFMPCLHSGATPQTSRWLGSSDFYLNIYIIRFRGVRTIAHGPWGRRYCAAVLTHVGQIFKPSIVAIYHDMPLSCFQNYRKNGCTAIWQLNGPRCTVT